MVGGADGAVSNGTGVGKDVERTGRGLCVKGLRKIIKFCLGIAGFQARFQRGSYRIRCRHAAHWAPNVPPLGTVGPFGLGFQFQRGQGISLLQNLPDCLWGPPSFLLNG